MSNEFLSGSYQFNNSPLYNFQLNRVVLWNHGDPGESGGQGKGDHRFCILGASVKGVILSGRTAEGLGPRRRVTSVWQSFYGAGHAGERDVYDRAQELFYANFAHLFSPQGGPIHRDEVPYESGTLPCWRITPPETSGGPSCSTAATTRFWRNSQTSCSIWPGVAMKFWPLRAPDRGLHCGSPV